MSDFEIAKDGTWMFPPDDGTSPLMGQDPRGEEVWQFPDDDGKTPIEELGPAVPRGPSSPSGPRSEVIEFPEDHVRAPSPLESARNWFSDLF